MHGIKWFVKCWFGYCGDHLRERLHRDNIHLTWNNIFFRRSYEFIHHLEITTGVTLITEHILQDDSALRDSLFMDLTEFWRQHHGPEITRELYPDWRESNREIGGHCRYGRSLVNGAACGYSILRTNRLMFRHVADSCRRGCGVRETVDHVLLVCPCYSEQRARIASVCKRVNIEFSVDTALCHPQVLPETETLFLSVIAENYRI